MKYELKTYTTAGLALLANAVDNGMTLTRLVVTNEPFTPNADLTAIREDDFKNEKVFTVNSQTSQDNLIKSATHVTNVGVTTDYAICAWGLIGKVGNTEAVVKVITTAENDLLTLPKYDSSAPVDLTVLDTIILKNADNIQVTSNPGAFAIDSMTVHNTGNESIDGQKDFKEMPTVNGVPISKTGGVVDLTTDQKIMGTKNFAGALQVNGNNVAADNSVVHLTGDEEVGGNKTFDNVPAVKTKGSLATEKYVDVAAAAKADDTKVVHKTGDEEIAGTKTFDTAPIDKTTGNPYITKDGVPAVPSTLADTTKLANFTKGLQKNGKDVATIDQVGSMIKPSSANTQDSALSDSKNDTSSYFTWE